MKALLTIMTGSAAKTLLIKNRLLLVTVGFVVGVLIVEVDLRIIKAFSAGALREDTAAAGDRPILCAGDSFVFGLGVPSEQSFPAQLGRMARSAAEHGGDQPAIVNLGIPGHNTAEVLEILRSKIDSPRPRTVILLCGLNNYWNFKGYSTFVDQHKAASSPLSFFRNLQTYKLIKLIAFNVRASKETLMSPKSGTAEERPETAKSALYSDRGWAARIRGENARAVGLFKKAIEEDPRNQENFRGLGITCLDLGLYPEAFESFKKCIELDPERQTRAYQQMVSLYHKAGDGSFKAGIKSYLRALKAEREVANPLLSDALEAINTDDRALAGTIDSWIGRDITEMITLCQARHIPVILLGYPDNPPLNRLIGRIAAKNNVPFVDNGIVFEDLMRGGRDAEYLLPDGHCTAKGYEIIATSVFRLLQKKQRYEGAVN